VLISHRKKSARDQWRAAGHITIKETLIKTVIFKRLLVSVIDSGILYLNTGWFLGGRRLPPQTCMSFETGVIQYKF
jgi:hypothetical protein